MDATLKKKTTKHTADSLSDFRTDNRVLTLSAMAAVIGAISAVVAYVLLWLIWPRDCVGWKRKNCAKAARLGS